MTGTVNLSHDLLAYLHTHSSKDPPEKVFQKWVGQAESIPSAQEVPMLMRMIENFQSSKMPSDLLNECYQETFRKRDLEEDMER